MSNQEKENKCVCCATEGHADYDDGIRKVVVRDQSKGGKQVHKGKMCEVHRQQFSDNGYKVS